MFELTESSLTRVWKHLTQTGKPIAFLSASRSQFDEKTNKARTAKLKSDVRAMGYGFFPVTGNYRYDDGTVATEESVAVPEMTEADAVKLGKKYDQESVLFVDGSNSGAVLLYTDGSGKTEKLGKFSPQTAAVAFSRLKGKGNDKNSTFTFEAKEGSEKLLNMILPRIATSVLSRKDLFTDGYNQAIKGVDSEGDLIKNTKGFLRALKELEKQGKGIEEILSGIVSNVENTSAATAVNIATPLHAMFQTMNHLYSFYGNIAGNMTAGHFVESKPVSKKTRSFIEEYNSTLRHLVGGKPSKLIEASDKEPTPAEIGEALIKFFSMKPDSSGKVKTGFGVKTPEGFYKSALSVYKEHYQGEKLEDMAALGVELANLANKKLVNGRLSTPWGPKQPAGIAASVKRMIINKELEGA